MRLKTHQSISKLTKTLAERQEYTMSGKFMGIKRIIIPTITMVIIASQLLGCAAVSKSELLTLLEQGNEIEIEIASPLAEAEQGEATSILWEHLALLQTNPELRKAWDDTLSITLTDTGKNGMLYVNADGDNINNNTLRVAMHNREFQKAIMEEGFLEELSDATLSQYADLEIDEVQKNLYVGINGYFNLLPDNTPNYANPDSTLNRAEFMAMVMRAETPVDENITLDQAFATAVGQNDLNIYAQALATDSYLDLQSKSLNNMTYNGTISRAEAVYLLMNHYYKDELANVDIKDADLEDVVDAGNIAKEQKFIDNTTERDFWKSYELAYAIQNADQGAPTDLYKALVLAESKGIIDTETRWDEGLTKAEAIELLVSVYMNEPGIPEFNFKQGKVDGHEVNLEDSSTTESTSSVDSTGVDVQLSEDEYQGTRPEDDGQPAETTSTNKELSPEAAEMAQYLKEWYESGIISKEEYDSSMDIIYGNSVKEQIQQLAQETLEELGETSNSGYAQQPVPESVKEMYTTGQGDQRTNIVYGQGDYSGAENYRIN